MPFGTWSRYTLAVRLARGLVIAPSALLDLFYHPGRKLSRRVV